MSRIQANKITTNDAVGVGGTPLSSAIFNVISTVKGAIPYPVMTTTQRNAIVSPAQFLTIANTTTGCVEFWSGSAWECLLTTSAGFANAHGQVSLTVVTTTPISATFTPTKASGTTVGTELDRFDMPVNNRLRYTGTSPITAIVSSSVSVTTSSNNVIIATYIAKNGVVVNSSQIRRKVSGGADVGAMASTVLVSMVTNDYVELWVENETVATGIQLEDLILIASAIVEG